MASLEKDWPWGGKDLQNGDDGRKDGEGAISFIRGADRGDRTRAEKPRRLKGIVFSDQRRFMTKGTTFAWFRCSLMKEHAFDWCLPSIAI